MCDHPEHDVGNALADPTPEQYMKFIQDTQDYLGSRYGDAWITGESDKTRVLHVGVVGFTQEDRAALEGFAGDYKSRLRLVGVKYSRSQLLSFQETLVASLIRTPGPLSSEPNVFFEGKLLFVSSIVRDSEHNRIVIGTGGPAELQFASGEDIPPTELAKRSVPSSIPPDAYVLRPIGRYRSLRRIGWPSSRDGSLAVD